MSQFVRRLAAAAQPVCLSAAATAVVALLSACGPSAPQGGPPQGPPQVAVAPAVQRDVQEFDEFTGRLEATESVDLRPRVAGYIEKIHFKEGQQVRRGDLLFSIDAAPYRAEVAKFEAQLGAARTQAELAKTEAARAERLLSAEAISQAEYDQQTSGLRNADANARAAEAALAASRLNVDYASVRAPISGRISRANITVGNLVSSDAVLTTLVSRDKVYAYFEASEQTYLKLVAPMRDAKAPAAGTAAAKSTDGKTADNKAATAAQGAVLMGLANEEGYPHRGVIDFIDNRLNPQTGSIRARAMFDNANGRFTPGLFARIKLLGAGTTPAVLTPDRAIGTDQSKKFVLVVGPDNVTQFRPVELGPVVDGMRVVRSGVQAGDLVVVNGLQRVRPGMPVTPQKLEIDAKGVPIEPPPPPPGAPGAGGASGTVKGAGKGEGKSDGKADTKGGEKGDAKSGAAPAKGDAPAKS